MRGLKVVVGVVAASAALAAASPPPLAQPGMCFRSADWNGWKATQDGSTLYIGAGVRSVFRLDLEHPCPELNDLDAKLITRTYGAPWVCHPSDLDLRVLRPGLGFASACRIRKISRLYPSEVQALPKAMRP